jgi:hypothetical protein
MTLTSQGSRRRLLLSPLLAFCLAVPPSAAAHVDPPVGFQTPVYDVEVIMRRIKCLKVVEGPFDDADDIYGKFLLGGYSYNRSSGSTEVKGCCIDGASDRSEQVFVFFDRPRDRAISLKKGQVWSVQTSHKMQGLDYSELMSLNFTLGARNILDWEPMHTYTRIYAYCSNCTVDDSFLEYKNMFRLVRMFGFKSQIDAMPTGTRDLMVGTDTILELHYYEGYHDVSDPESKAHIMGEFTIRVTKR